MLAAAPVDYGFFGVRTYGDVELLALLIGGPEGLVTAGRLLERYAHLDGLARAEVSDLATVPGVDASRAVQLHVALQLGRRSLRAVPRSDAPVDSAEAAARWLAPALTHLDEEELHALYLDRRGRPLALRQLARGSDRFTIVDPRQIFRPAVAIGAAMVVLAHNHPSGDPTPSQEDRDITLRVAKAGQVLAVNLVDHLVIGHADWTSLAALGCLAAWEASPIWTR